MQKHDWQKIYSESSPKLLGICRRYIPDIYTAEDIVQDSFIAAMQNNHQLKDEKALFGWLKKIVVNNALMYLRKHSRDVFVNTEPSEIPDTLSEMNHPSLDEKHIFIYDFTRDQLLSSIDSLPEHHKSVFNLFFIENHSHAEISGLLGITVNTSKSHLLRAKKSVQNFLINNFVNQDTPKNNKKMAQLLVIFGLGGLLWAQTFNSKFSDFNISPSRKLEIPENIKIKSLAFSTSSGQVLTKKIIFGSTIFVIIVGSIFFLSPKNTFSLQNNSVLVKEKQETQNTETQNLEKTSHLSSDNISVNENSNTASLKNSQENISEIKTNTGTVKSKNIKKIIPKDSIEEAPQKVIIVKKIIKRDTIFVER